ncbi:ribosome small subunit-dependent GTPase A [Cytobacillus sp. FJAT-54145]|uniref:Small ribosomal subunit biogenesis GTPase RsgA n=1 Tax=Cytobacillus spartinae TaxID=3299023 RepID=A0ABW6KEF5_9BACI
MNLNKMGFNEFFQNDFQANYSDQTLIVGRVALEHKRLYRVWTEVGELLCEVSGKFSFNATSREDYPAVGDWVVLNGRPEEQKGTIHGVLSRKSKFSRKVAGETTDEQIVATNVDTVFLVSSLNDDLNLRRLERYLLLTWESGANPVIVLTKTDLASDIHEKVSAIEAVALGVPIIPISVVDGTGIEELTRYVESEKTIALLGSSGVGKSTIMNYFLGEEKQKVQGIREDDAKGRHTTTHREMVLLPNGAILIDTPGMREIQLWEGGEGLSESFSDIEQLADRCKFRDCTHKNEPGCAVLMAIEDGVLDADRLHSYKKLLKELAYLDRKLDKRAQAAEKSKWKSINKQIKNRR